MPPTPGDATALFLELGTPGEITKSASVSEARPGVNAHVHLPPNFSAFESVAQAVALAAGQGVEVLGASNYYDYSVYAEFAREAAGRGVVPLFGIEIIAFDDGLARDGIKVNDPGNPGKMYVCGKGITRFDPMTAEAAHLLQTLRDKDSARMASMTDRLAELFAGAGLETRLDEAGVKARVVARHGCPPETVYLQERHVAQAFQEVLFEKAVGEQRRAFLKRLFGVPAKNADDANAVQNDIRTHLMKAGRAAYVEETFVGFDHARRLVLALGGIPCYPVLADGADPLCAFEAPVETLIANIRARGLPAAEFIPTRNSPETLGEYVRAARQAGIVVTAGTEHNTRELSPLMPTCAGGIPIPGDLQDLFWEGACVLAAHQYLAFTGRAGFVSDEGDPNPDYDSVEARIAAFRGLGEAVIAVYRQKHAPGRRFPA